MFLNTYLQKLTQFEYKFILFVAKLAHNFVKFQETDERNVTLALQIINIAPAKILLSASLKGGTIAEEYCIDYSSYQETT